MFPLFSRFCSKLIPVEDGRIDLGAKPYAVFDIAADYGVTVYKTTEGFWLFDRIAEHVWLGSLPLDTKDSAIKSAAAMFYRGFDLGVNAMRERYGNETITP